MEEKSKPIEKPSEELFSLTNLNLMMKVSLLLYDLNNYKCASVVILSACYDYSYLPFYFFFNKHYFLICFLIVADN